MKGIAMFFNTFGWSIEALLEKAGRYLDDKVSIFTIQPVESEDGRDKRQDYLKRWYLFRLTEEAATRWPRVNVCLNFLKQEIGIELYLHRITEDDQDRHLHDHPWSFVAIQLHGGYTEFVPKPGTNGVKEDDRVPVERSAPGFHWKFSDGFHRVKLFRENGDESKKVVSWSLVIRGKKKKDWGFSTEEGWVSHDKYLDDLYGKGQWEREPHYYEEKVNS